MLSNAPRAPYSLEPTAFPCPAIVALCGRAPLGGPRETALACFVLARLVLDARGLPAELRKARAQGARHWLGAAAVPAAVRPALMRLADATADDSTGATGGDRGLKAALDSVIAVTANQLDGAARLELARLTQAVAR